MATKKIAKIVGAMAELKGAGIEPTKENVELVMSFGKTATRKNSYKKFEEEVLAENRVCDIEVTFPDGRITIYEAYKHNTKQGDEKVYYKSPAGLKSTARLEAVGATIKWL